MHASFRRKEISACTTLKQNTLLCFDMTSFESLTRFFYYVKTVPLKSVYCVVTGLHNETLSHGFLPSHKYLLT